MVPLSKIEIYMKNKQSMEVNLYDIRTNIGKPLKQKVLGLSQIMFWIGIIMQIGIVILQFRGNKKTI